MLDDDQGLVVVRDSLVINLSHVLGHTDLLVVVLKFFAHRIGLKINICDLVGALVAPISDHARSNDLLCDKLLVLGIIFSLLLELVDLVQAGNGGHKAEERVNSDRNSRLAHEDGSLVAFEHLQPHCCQFVIGHRSLIVEELRIATNLPQVRLPESRLEDDIKDTLDDRVLVVDELFGKLSGRLS